MKIYVNGELMVASSDTLADLLRRRDIAEEAVATAVDGVFVPRQKREMFALAEGMAIEILAPMQGG